MHMWSQPTTPEIPGHVQVGPTYAGRSVQPQSHNTEQILGLANTHMMYEDSHTHRHANKRTHTRFEHTHTHTSCVEKPHRALDSDSHFLLMDAVCFGGYHASPLTSSSPAFKHLASMWPTSGHLDRVVFHIRVATPRTRRIAGSGAKVDESA